MANYADSVWNAAQYKLSEMMNKPEFKHKPSAALSVFLKNTNFLVPASERERLWNQKTSDQQTVSTYNIEKQTVALGSARAAAHTGAVGDSGTADVSYTTYSRKFKYSIKRADRNIFSTAEMLAAQVRSASIDLHAGIETALMSYLNTNKSQVVIGLNPQSGEWDATNYLFGVLNADADQYFQYFKTFMSEQYYGGTYDVINNVRAQANAMFLGQQGQGNATNLGWQIDGMNMVASTELANASGYDQMSYFIPEGTIGILPWIPSLNRQGFGDTFQNGGVYRSLPDPLGSGLTFAVHEYATGADNENNGAETQDVDIQVEISIDLGPVKAPMSTSNLTSIFKGGLLQ
jgi:hypothetical protein